MGLEIRLYTRDNAGKLEDLFDADAPFFATCPAIGDVVTISQRLPHCRCYRDPFRRREVLADFVLPASPRRYTLFA